VITPARSKVSASARWLPSNKECPSREHSAQSDLDENLLNGFERIVSRRNPLPVRIWLFYGALQSQKMAALETRFKPLDCSIRSKCREALEDISSNIAQSKIGRIPSVTTKARSNGQRHHAGSDLPSRAGPLQPDSLLIRTGWSMSRISCQTRLGSIAVFYVGMEK